MSRIHPTAVVDPSAEIGETAEIGAFAVVEADVSIGEGCVLRPHSIVRRYTRMGRGNFVDSFAVLGGLPQDLKFDEGCRSWLHIGDDNVFREHVTLSRATGAEQATVIGSRNYWMTGSHAGHNARVGDNCIITNNTALAGHAELGDRVVLSTCIGVHQFCWVGEGTMVQGGTMITMHLPPFCLANGINHVAGLNSVGLRRRPDITAEDRRQIREAYQIVYRSALPLGKALEQMERCTDWAPPAGRFREFIRRVYDAQPPHRRGLCPSRYTAANASVSHSSDG